MIRRKTLLDGSTAYLVRYGRGGKAKTFHRYADAEEYEAELKRAAKRSNAGLETLKDNITFSDLHALWVANFSPSQWRLSMSRHSSTKWGTARVRDIQPEAVGRWINTIDRAEKTRAHILETFRQIMNAGVEWGYLAKSPARRGAFKVPSKRARTRPIRPFESWAEVEEVANACKKHGAFVRFVCATGLRPPGEVMHLTWDAVQRHDRNILVGSKTEAGHRTVPLSTTALTALDQIPRNIDNGRIFRFNYEGWRRNEWRKALADAGMDQRDPYEMRHTFATLALSHGAHIDDLATVMGHEDITVTYNFYRKWIRTMADRLRTTLDQIGATDESTSHHANGLHSLPPLG